MLRSIVLLSCFLALLAAPVCAVHTVEELYQQGERTAAEMGEVKSAMDGIQTTVDNSIKSTGVRTIIILTLEFIFLQCAVYLLRIFHNYRNRVELRKHRDLYVETMRKEVQLLRRKNVAIERENSLLSNAHEHLLNVIKLSQPENPAFRFLAILGVFIVLMMLTMMMLVPAAPSGKGVDYVVFLPAAIGLLFLFLGAKYFLAEKTRYVSYSKLGGMRQEDSGIVAPVDAPDPEDIEAQRNIQKNEDTKQDNKIKWAGVQAIVDGIKGLQEEKPTGSSLDKVAELRDSGAEVKAANGLASITLPITEEQRKRAEELAIQHEKARIEATLKQAAEVVKKMDLPDIEEAFDEPEKKPSVENKDITVDMQYRVFEAIKNSKSMPTAGEITKALGLSIKDDLFKVMIALRRLKLRGKIEAELHGDKNRWKIVG